MPNDLHHIIGCSQEKFSAIPQINRKLASKEGASTLSMDEKYAVTEEQGSASNLHKLNLEGTHYLDQSPQDIELLMLML